MSNYYETKEKLNKVFRAYRKAGYVARQDFACCTGCACAEIGNYLEEKGVAKKNRKAVYYHRQNTDRLKATGDRVMIGWQGNGTEICDIAKKHGFITNWNGSENEKIELIYEPENTGTIYQPV